MVPIGVKISPFLFGVNSVTIPSSLKRISPVASIFPTGVLISIGSER